MADSNGTHTFDVDPSGLRIVATGRGFANEGAETHLMFLFNFFDEVRRKVRLP